MATNTSLGKLTITQGNRGKLEGGKEINDKPTTAASTVRSGCRREPDAARWRKNQKPNEKKIAHPVVQSHRFVFSEGCERVTVR